MNKEMAKLEKCFSNLSAQEIKVIINESMEYIINQLKKEKQLTL